MAEGDKIIKLPDDDDRIVPRNQDQRGNTGRIIDAPKLEDDVNKALGKSGENTVDSTLADEDAQETVAELRAKLKREQAARIAAENRADTATETVGATLDAKTQSDLNTLKTAKAHLAEQQDQIKKDLAAAHGEGDFDAVAEINHRMVQAAQQMSSLENGIIALENAPKQREALIRRGEPGDARFQQITKGMAPEAKKWFRDNPEYYQNDTKLQRVVAAHNMVMTVDDPPEVNSDDYFQLVQAELRDPKFDRGRRIRNSGGDRGNDNGNDQFEDDALSDASRGERRGEAPPAGAPVSRSGRGTGGTGSFREVRITAAEQEIAASNGQTNEEYMANKRALAREGRLGAGSNRNRNDMH